MSTTLEKAREEFSRPDGTRITRTYARLGEIADFADQIAEKARLEELRRLEKLFDLCPASKLEIRRRIAELEKGR